MTTETATMIAPTNPDHQTDVRMSAEQLAKLRPLAPRRYLARLMTWGESVHPEERRPLGIVAPLIVITGPWLGDELAASAVGIPVNLGRRRPDGVLSHWTPTDPGKFLHGLHLEILSGFVARAWPDKWGLMGELLITRGEIVPDLDIAEATGELWSCGLCLLHTALEMDVSRVRFTGHHVAVIRHARAFALDFAGLPLSPGCRLLRRLEDGEEVQEDEGSEPDHRLIFAPPRPSEIPVAPGHIGDLVNGAVQQPQLGIGSVGTTNVQTQAITNNISNAGGAVVFGMTETVIAQATLTTGGASGNVLVSASVRHLKLSGADDTASFFLRKDHVLGEILDVADGFHIAGWLSTSVQGVDSAPGGAQIYVVTAKRNVAGSGQAKAALSAVIYKR